MRSVRAAKDMQNTLPLPAAPANQPPQLSGLAPFYSTGSGAAYLGDATELFAHMPDDSVNLVVTSPPYALHFEKEYGNVAKASYVDWFRPFGEQIKRVLRDDGSFVLNIGGSYNPGTPTRSLYHFKVLLMLCEDIGFKLAQECFWFNRAKLPAPAEWVNVRRMRIKDAVEYVWWFSKTEWPKADNTRVLGEYSADMHRLIARGFRPKKRPSGWNIKAGFGRDRGGSIPPNVVEEDFLDGFAPDVATNIIERGNNESNSEYIRACQTAGLKPHPARFPRALPEFFIKFLTEQNDLVVDPFSGSNMTGAVAEELGRRWLGFELREDYLAASAIRFNGHVK
jgi:DNA modification methylase